MTFTPTKPVQTRDGHKARIVSDNSSEIGYKYIAVITQDHGGEYAATFSSEGYYDLPGGECGLDLINVPEKREMWVNVYDTKPLYRHNTRDIADKEAGLDRIACVWVEYEVGEGL